MKSDLEIARASALLPIDDVAAQIDLSPSDLIHYGPHIAKVRLELAERLAERPQGKLILVSAMTPTSMGEGKTTNTADAGGNCNAGQTCAQQKCIAPYASDAIPNRQVRE